MTEAPRQEVVRPATDFSELHREETARRLGLLDPEVIRKEKEEAQRERDHDEMCRRRRAEADAPLWALLPDDDNDEEEQVEQQPEPVQEVEMVAEPELPAPQEQPREANLRRMVLDGLKDISCEHLRRRMAILRDGVEDNLTHQEFRALPAFDRARIQFVQALDWNPGRVHDEAMNFIWLRIQYNMHNPVTLAGHVSLLDELEPIMLPHVLYLSQFLNHPLLHLYERWFLYGV